MSSIAISGSGTRGLSLTLNDQTPARISPTTTRTGRAPRSAPSPSCSPARSWTTVEIESRDGSIERAALRYTKAVGTEYEAAALANLRDALEPA